MNAVYEQIKAVFDEHPELFGRYKIELLRGDIVMTAGPEVIHNYIVEAVQDQIPRERWRRLQTQDVAMLEENGEPRPDLVVVERGAGPETGRLVPSEAITLLVEVVSKSSLDRDYGVKRALYAAAKVPAYLIIDPYYAGCLLLTEPRGKGEDADYAVEYREPFGHPMPLDVLGIELDTSEFGTLPQLNRRRRRP
ncbi:Uma2 family endonuclease [Streptomyces sp. NRRL S-244]|uniref:Uma2 family endonuclease n=1 Tax=Streptomyces sp. NRRL S-244 TaxID=1463897 RepID=UPI00055B9863|nr:Uma2 family endonuclease [Streptomyces sp. NRRL S-244]